MLEKMKSDRVIVGSASTGLVAMVILGGFLSWFWRNLPPEVPLLYSLPWGETQLTSPSTLIGILFVCVLIFFCHTIAAVEFLDREPLLGKIIAAAGAVTIVLLVTTGTMVILLSHF